ncbi:hypothetical protein EOL96_09640, partial [Candidatus Saccharibacteria bacterium]|nr:hypothetical protein [Candidatus Saccharibacteria bacterium]
MEKNMTTSFEWSSFSDADKQFFRSLKAVFVMAPREMSDSRLLQLVKENLSKGNVVFGVAEEEFVDGFEGQIQFKTLPVIPVQTLADKIRKSGIKNRLYVLTYLQKDIDAVVRAIRPREVVIVRGSYMYPFHRGSTCALLEKRNILYEYVSPFVDEAEVVEYYELRKPQEELTPGYVTKGDEKQMMQAVMQA